MTARAPLAWVVGAGGLLGRNVEAALRRLGDGGAIWTPPAATPWDDEHSSARLLAAEAEVFLDAAAAGGHDWRLLWCAGAGVVATSPGALAQETRVLAHVLDRVAARLTAAPALAGRGLVFHASSAGGVYSASPAPPPFDERSPAAALAPYGREKLAQEALVAGLGAEAGVDVLIGRFSNLYGPGQKLAKPQGLVSHVGRSALRRQPVSIYVPLDTIRDYLFSEDAGRMTAAALARMEAGRARRAGPETVVKIFASEVETTVASVLGVWRQVLRRPLLVALGGSPAGRLQPRVLSFRSLVWPELRGRPTLLPLGVEAVRRDQLARLLAAGLG